MSWSLIAAMALATTLWACGDDPLKCGAGTVAQGDRCVPAEDALPCGEGTAPLRGECVPIDLVECGEGTAPDDDGRCVPVDPIECGPGTTERDGQCVPSEQLTCGLGTELVDGACVAVAQCGEGTLEVDGVCEVIDPLDGVELFEAEEPNDPALGGVAGSLTLGADGETVVVAGALAPQGTGRERVADFDVFVFEGVAGQRLGIEATAVGAPEVAFSVVFMGQEGQPGYERLGFPFGGRNARRQVVLPFDGSYMLRVGTAADTAAAFGQGALGGIFGQPDGGQGFTWMLGVTSEVAVEPQVFEQDAFSMEGSLLDVPEARVSLPGGTILSLSLEVEAGVLPAVSMSDAGRGGWAEVEGLVVVPEGGALLTVDHVAARAASMDFALRAEVQGLSEVGALAPGQARQATGPLQAEGLFLARFTTDGPVVLEAAAVVEGQGNAALLVMDEALDVVASSTDEDFQGAARDEALQVFLPGAGVWYAAVRAEGDAPEPGAMARLTLSSVPVSVLDALVPAGQGREASAALVEGAAFFLVTPTQAGVLRAEAAGEGVDVALELFEGTQIGLRQRLFVVAQADEAGAGQAERLLVPVLDGARLVRASRVAGQGTSVDFAVALEAAFIEEEPNDAPQEANFLGALGQEPRRVIAVRDGVDLFDFSLVGPAQVSIRALGVEGGPAGGLSLSLRGPGGALGGDDSPGGAALELALGAGRFTLEVFAPQGPGGGRYALELAVVEPFACLPGSTTCGADAVLICDADGQGESLRACAGSCDEVAGFAECGGQVEVEPNDDPGSAQRMAPLAPGRQGVGGALAEGDEDFFAFSLPQAAAVVVGTAPAGPGPAPDTTLRVLGAGDRELAFDDDGGPDGFSLIELRLEPGQYQVAVGLSGRQGGRYRLFVEVTPPQCQPGQRACDGATLLACDGFELAPDQECAFGCDPEAAACVPPPFVPEEEPNDGPALRANEIGVIPFLGQGAIDPASDQDWWALELTRGATLRFSTDEADPDDQVDTRIFVCSQQQALSQTCTFNGQNMARNDDIAFPEDTWSALTVTLEPGRWFFVVESFAGDTGQYLIEVAEQRFNGEPNDAIGQATPIGAVDRVEFAIDFGGDRDFYALEIPDALVGLPWQLRTAPVDGGRRFDPTLSVCTAQGPACQGDNLLAFDDDSGPELYPALTFTPTRAGTFIIVVEGINIDAIGQYRLEVSIDAHEPNDQGADATDLPLDEQPLVGDILPGDADWYRVEVQAGDAFFFGTFPIIGLGQMDTRIFLCDTPDPEACAFAQGDLARNDDRDFETLYSELGFAFEEAGTYFLVVTGFDADEIGAYAIVARDANP